eukprot:GHVN01057505.1.p1 GENE.GHVN01057505.1~~GHVN01057505.1.p1  ORF type:complete len:617 (-),score=94.40 GHVN01057505.1:351-2201(-)
MSSNGGSGKEGNDSDTEYKSTQTRRLERQKLLLKKKRQQREHERTQNESDDGGDSEVHIPQIKATKRSLLATAHKLRAQGEAERGPDYETEMVKAEEARMIEQVQQSMNAPLLSVKERAKGIVYTSRVTTSYRLPKKYQDMPEEQAQAKREALFIDISGSDAPPPIASFAEMGLPRSIVEGLTKKGISTATQIQRQGLPAALLGRDLIGIAFTGSGKTLVFALPMLLFALEMHLKSPIQAGEGPFGLVVCPSRELAGQTLATIEYFRDCLVSEGYPRLEAVCIIGGVSVMEQGSALRRGVHMAVATPGRLNDMLAKRRMQLCQCNFLALDEADRLIDLGFEDELRNILDHFEHQRQTLLFSATMPRKIQHFAERALVDPITVNVGRAGAANLDVSQEVEYVKQEAKLPHLLSCLQKTMPPVLIFCENKRDVDDVHEYLLLKGVGAVGIHGGLAQEERNDAIKSFRDGRKDILVGTDVASKGLDFPAIQHVINYDMPKEIENYVHRIGRTGRCGNFGVATTFINKSQDETILLDLKALLIEAKQRIPPFLAALDSGGMNLQEINGIKGCGFCGGLGHRIAQCPKLQTQKAKQMGGAGKDYLTSESRYGVTAGYGGDW